MSFITGTYELLSDTEDPTYDKYLKVTGVSDADRESWAMVRPKLEISLSGDQYTIKTLSELKNMEFSFRLGKEFEEVLPDNRMSAITFVSPKDNQLVQVQKMSGVQAQITREFSADGMTEILTAGGVTAIRKYKRV
ncbi:MAG: lipocalin/fatty-acid binding family protein [Caldilineaceae bacterium]|nr:lipocalin/fatty-acid binding family protein [Caldilineaceae bacterium]